MSIPGEFPLIGKTAGQLFDDTVEKFSDSEALVICQEQRLTYADLKAEVGILPISLKSTNIHTTYNNQSQ